MYFTLGEVIFIFLFCALCLYFLAATRVRELAIQAVKRASERDNFQLLDQTALLCKISLSRTEHGRWRVWRQYRFDYSYDGVERQQGHVIMLGKQLLAIVVNERNPSLY